MEEIKSNNYPSISQGFGIVGILILGMILFMPIYLVINDILGNEASMLIYYVLAVGTTFFMAYVIRKKRTDKHSFKISIENKRIIPFIVMATIALLFGVISPISNLIPMPEFVKKIALSSTNQNGIYAFIMMVIAAPVLEEFIFRGIILDGFLDKYAPLKSILISSLLFGLAHLNPWQFVTGFVIGVFSGWIYYKTRSLLPSIIIHASANLTGYLLRFLISDASMMKSSSTEMYGGIANLLLIIIGSLVVLSICIVYLRKEFDKVVCKSDV